ncbi:hypothetical protein CRE_02375 [Caenorhabditis remanei]|uniref:Uncharacterized protein n=1 Tax=Caenorhabditis remanei TaxID=31234 RepID=E3MIH4_CAERE|nr:hypothetical protein CRE_02375 [Caenorhabditis remanei]
MCSYSKMSESQLEIVLVSFTMCSYSKMSESQLEIVLVSGEDQPEAFKKR